MAVPGKILLTEEEIKKKVRELAEKISLDYMGEEVLMVGVLKGVFVFLSDLMRMTKLSIKVDFMAVKSYAGTETTGKVEVLLDLREDVKDRHVLIVEDIVDTGLTLDAVSEIIAGRKPRSLRICALLDKKERRIKDVPLDYIGFMVPNRFLVGYGLDFEGKFRNLPCVVILEEK